MKSTPCLVHAQGVHALLHSGSASLLLCSLQIGRQLLKSTKIDKFQSLAYITTFLSK